jgi:RNA polymerase sigma factor (sigma-70 family)
MAEYTEQEIVQILDDYRPIVRRIAHSAITSSAVIDIADFYQIGEIAVLQAIRAYDPSCGTNIRSYVSRSVRRAIFNEAARFLGVLTVDRRVTEVAAKASKLSEQGFSDRDIARRLNQDSSRNFDEDHVRDLRIAYARRHIQVEEDCAVEESVVSIEEFLSGVPTNDTEQYVLKHKILGRETADSIATFLSISRSLVYEIEAALTARIEEAIRDGA